MVRRAVLACWLLAGCDLVFPVGAGPSSDGPVGGDGTGADAGDCGSLRMWHDFESTDVGLAVDHSGCNNNASLINAFPAPSHDGSAAIAVTATSVVEIDETGLLDFSGAFTIAAWINVNGIGGTGQLGWILRNPAQYGMTLTQGAGFHCELGSGVTTNATIQFSNWLHVACTSDGSVTIAYVNGAGIDCVAQTPRGDSGSSGTWIGAGGPMIETLDAFIDDVRIYDRALSYGEVCTLAGQTGCISALCPL